MNKDICTGLKRGADKRACFLETVKKYDLRFLIALGFVCSAFYTYAESTELPIGVSLTPEVVKTTSSPASFKLNLVSYNKEEYLLAYNVFVMNGSVELAYEVAMSAVKQRPADIFWRQKLVNVALWLGHPKTALDQWMYFINNNISPESYRADALKLAGQINDYDSQAVILKQQLQKTPDNKKLQLQYAIVLQSQGYPEDALNYLKQIPDSEQDPAFLEQYVNIAKGLDDLSLELNYLKKLESIDKTAVAPLLEHAEILYLKGDIDGAWSLLKARAHQPGNKIAFWRNYAALSILSGQNDAAIQAYKQLIDNEAIDNSSLLQMITLEETQGKNLQAYEDAKMAWSNTHNPALIPVILGLGEQLQKWQEMKAFITALPPKELHKLESKPLSSLLLVNIKVHTGLVREIHKAWAWVFNRWPNEKSVKQAYIWYLMDNYDVQQMEYTLVRFRKVFEEEPALWNSYASGLVSTGDNSRALNVMLRHRQEITASYTLLTGIANAMVQNNLDFSAYYTAQKAFYLLRRQINRQNGRVVLTDELLLAELMQLLGSDVYNYEIIRHLSRGLFTNPLVDNQVMSFALKKQSYSLASYIEGIHDVYHQETPAWMTLTLALVYNDRYAMSDVLFKYPKLLPYRDRVTAAVRTGNIKLAEDYAYTGLRDHQFDDEMYKLFQDTMLPRADRFSADGGLYYLGNVGGPFELVSGKFFVTPSIAILPYALIWEPKVIKEGQIPVSLDTDSMAGLAIRKYIHRGWVQAVLGARHSLENNVIAKLRWERIMTPRTKAMFYAGYHVRATESDLLLIAGMKNELDASFNTIYDSYNQFNYQFSVMQFRGQDETFLGTGQVVRLNWQRKFYLNYPDWNINFYGTWANYQNSNNVLSPVLQKFLPPFASASTEFYTPQSYIEGAVTLGLGQQYRKGYTHDWKFFSEAGLLYSTFGLGGIAQGGLAGSVFGRDHLVLYGEYSLNQQQQSQTNYTIGIRYDNYF